MHKDLRGNPIYVGQEVVYTANGPYGAMHKVHAFTPKRVRLDHPHGVVADPQQLVALPYSNTPTVVAVLVPLPNGGLLGIRRANEPQAGKIALPAGYQMAGETWQEAGAREVLEETGFKLDPKRIYFQHYAGTDTYGNNMVFGHYDPIGREDGSFEYTIADAIDGPKEVLEVLTIERGKEYDWAFPLHQAAAEDYLWASL